MSRTRLILDIATCPLTECDGWLPDVKAAKNLVDPAKIAADIEKRKAEQRDGLALDCDFCRISALGWIELDPWGAQLGEPQVAIMPTEQDERALLNDFRPMLKDAETITFNGLNFDLPVLERRYLYNGIKPLGWNLDRYRSPHIDLLARLTNHGLRPMRALTFYAKRLGWTDLSKPLPGAEEAQAVAEGRFDELKQSVLHDLVATHRLAAWMQIIEPVAVSA